VQNIFPFSSVGCRASGTCGNSLAGRSAASEEVGSAGASLRFTIEPRARVRYTVPLLFMAFLNDNYLKLKAGYLFPEIGRRVKAFTDANAGAAKRMIRCGIGDVTEPLPAAVRTA